MTAKPFVSLIACGLTLTCSNLAWAQNAIGELLGTTDFETFGAAAVSLGDVDGDSVPDFAVSSPHYLIDSTQAGRVQLRSGASLTSLWTVVGIAPKDDFGYALADVGDLDGDGVLDLLVGAPDLVTTGHAPVAGPGYVQVRSGASGALIHHVDGITPQDMFGVSVIGLGDLDGDGVGDFAVGANRGAGGKGEVRLFSGSTAAVLGTIQGPQSASGFGLALARVGDIDGDGRAEFVVGAPDFKQFFGPKSGAAYLYSGAGFVSLWSGLGSSDVAEFGAALSGPGDLDLDGVPDFAVGAPSASGPIGFSGAVHAYSGATQSPIFTVFGPATSSSFGRKLAGLGDLTGDGRPELLVGVPNSVVQGGYSGHVSVLSGQLGQEVGRAYGKKLEYLGSSVALLGDLTGDGLPEFSAGGIDGDFDERGMLRIYSAGLPMPPSSYCTGKVNSQGCTPVLTSSGTPTLSGADDFVVSATLLLNNKPSVVIWSEGAAAQSAFDATLCLAAPIVRMTTVSSGGSPLGDDCSGSISQPFSHAYLIQKGLTASDVLHVQVWYRDPGLPTQQAGFSQALAATLAP